MKIYEFGSERAPVILLLPGTCCHWRANFGTVIPLLEQDFRVSCVSYDGFDETEQTVFPDMLTETAKIEEYIQTNYGGHICAAYGCSLGGSFVGLLVQRGNVRIDHAILGSSDLDQDSGLSARFKAWLIGKVLYGMFQKGKLPSFMQKRLEKKPTEDHTYYEKMMDMFGMNNTRMAFVLRESIRNQFYSDLVTPIKNNIFVPGTTIHCLFPAKMGGEYLRRYQQHFQNPNPAAVIRVENISGPVLLISSKMDTMWPSEPAAKKIMERLWEHNFSYPYQHLSYDYGSHLFVPMELSLAKLFVGDRGKYKELSRKARMDSLTKTLEFVSKW